MNPVSDDPDIWLIQRNPKNKFLNIGSYSIILFKRAQSWPVDSNFYLFIINSRIAKCFGAPSIRELIAEYWNPNTLGHLQYST